MMNPNGALHAAKIGTGPGAADAEEKPCNMDFGKFTSFYREAPGKYDIVA